MKLLCLGNPKTAKGESYGYLTGIMHLAPAKLSGYNVCPMASVGCAAACLNTSGRGRFTRTQDARIKKTKRFFEHRDEFMKVLVKDIQALVRKAKREGLTPAVRLNGTSDIRWENEGIMEQFPTVQFYDYSKLANRRNLPSNYHLTFSRSESNSTEVETVMKAGTNVAVVFNRLPTTWQGREVIDGTAHDLRFLDKKGVVVGLVPKGSKGKEDRSGFVVMI